jgi:hypothetical protein
MAEHVGGQTPPAVEDVHARLAAVPRDGNLDGGARRRELDRVPQHVAEHRTAQDIRIRSNAEIEIAAHLEGLPLPGQPRAEDQPQGFDQRGDRHRRPPDAAVRRGGERAGGVDDGLDAFRHLADRRQVRRPGGAVQFREVDRPHQGRQRVADVVGDDGVEARVLLRLRAQVARPAVERRHQPSVMAQDRPRGGADDDRGEGEVGQDEGLSSRQRVSVDPRQAVDRQHGARRDVAHPQAADEGAVEPQHGQEDVRGREGLGQRQQAVRRADEERSQHDP